MSGYHLRVLYVLTLYVIDCAVFLTGLCEFSIVSVTVKKGISKGCNFTRRRYGGVMMTVGWFGKRKEPPEPPTLPKVSRGAGHPARSRHAAPCSVYQYGVSKASVKPY